MDFKAKTPVEKGVVTLADGTQQADFQYDFALNAKAMEHTVDEHGDLWIEGYASDFGLDRQDEAFEPDAFQRGLKTFLERNPIMLYHHQYDKALGQFADAKLDSNGLWVKGRVDKPAPGSWAEDVFNKIARGTIKSFSVGGLFRRRMTPNGPRIYDVDLGEISVTPFPVNPRTTFAVVAKKAFENVEGKAEEAGAVIEEVAEVVEVTPAPAPVVEGEEHVETPAPETPAEEPPAEETPAEETPEAEVPVIEDGSVTGEKIAPGSIGTEHLSDELRSRFSELAPEAPSIEDAHARLEALAAQLEGVFEKLGIQPPETPPAA